MDMHSLKQGQGHIKLYRNYELFYIEFLKTRINDKQEKIY
jgi:hypothetical protein